MNFKQSYWALLIICIIILAGCWVRFDNLSGHFTHIDDLLVASNIMKKNNVEEIHEAIASNDSKSMEKHKKRGLFATLYSVKDNRFLDYVTFHYLNFVDKFYYVSKISTYAPLQCGITSWWVDTNDASGYESIKWQGRLMSCLCGSASLVILGLFLLSFYIKEESAGWLALLATTILAFSWENIVYSQQMEPYTIAVLMHIITLWIMFKFKREGSWRYYLLMGFVLGFFVMGHYQMLFTGTAFIAALGWLNRNSRTALLKTGMFSVAFAIMVKPLLSFLLSRSDGGINWNAGSQNEFVFSALYDTPFDWWNWLVYFIEFFFKNVYLTTRALIGFLPNENSFLVNLITCLVLLLFLTGLVSGCLQFKKIAYWKTILTYTFFFCFIWFVLILLGKITLSPTRHSMVLLPLMLLFTVEGLRFLVASKPLALIVISISWSGVLFFSFFGFYDQEKKIRTDLISENLIDSMISIHKPELVVSYGFTDNMKLYSKRNSIAHIEINSLSGDYNMYCSNREQLDQNFEGIQGLSPKRVLLLSARTSWRKDYNIYLDRLLNLKLENYKLVSQREIRSDRQVEYSTLTHNGTNELFYYVLEKKN